LADPQTGWLPKAGMTQNISYLNNQKCPQILAQKSPIAYALSPQNPDTFCAFTQIFADFPNQPFYAQADAIYESL